jgi:hypothetical protein
MGFIPPVLLSSATQFALVSMQPAALGLTLNVTKDFFQNLFLNPQNHTTAVMIIGGVCVVSCVGIAFLIKFLYDKYHPKKT